MQPARETWTDERLDDLSNRVDRGFGRVEREFTVLRGDVDQRFDQVDKRFDQVDTLHQVDQRFERVEGELGDLRRTVQRFGTGIIFVLLVALTRGQLG